VESKSERKTWKALVAKRTNEYLPGGNDWLKTKNKAYSQADWLYELLTKRK